MKKTAVIAGGWSGERAISLISGECAAKALPQALAIDLLPDKGAFSTPKWAKPVRLSALIPFLRRHRIQTVLLCLHGPFGEDGRIQGLLDMAGIKYTGSGALASAMAMHKRVSKQVYQAHGLPTPAWALAMKGQPAPKFKLPCVVKPVEQGSALGISIVKKASQMRAALKLAWRHGTEALIEAYIPGRELTVGVLGAKALPVVEIVPNKAEFYDYASKYGKGGSTHFCPAPISGSLARLAQHLGLKAHQALGCRGFSRTDLMLDKKGKLWILETNTLPGLTPVSLLPDAARAAGISYGMLLKEMIRLS